MEQGTVSAPEDGGEPGAMSLQAFINGRNRTFVKEFRFARQSLRSRKASFVDDLAFSMVLSSRLSKARPIF
jgi:hypothetical protein